MKKGEVLHNIFRYIINYQYKKLQLRLLLKKLGKHSSCANSVRQNVRIQQNTNCAECCDLHSVSLTQIDKTDKAE